MALIDRLKKLVASVGESALNLSDEQWALIKDIVERIYIPIGRKYRLNFVRYGSDFYNVALFVYASSDVRIPLSFLAKDDAVNQREFLWLAKNIGLALEVAENLMKVDAPFYSQVSAGLEGKIPNYKQSANTRAKQALYDFVVDYLKSAGKRVWS